jgi:serine/threonine protein phosphatase 1
MLGNLLKRLSGIKSDDLTYPRLPREVTVYVIGDIHGCLDPLSHTLKAIDTDIERTRPHYSAEIYLGDYVDRGPDSAGVLECLIQRQKIRRMIFIKGNHDEMFEDFISGTRALTDWLPYGGGETLRSYGATAEQIASNSEEIRHLVPAHHLSFLSHCEPSFQIEDYFFTHAGVKPGITLNSQARADLMWIREEFLNYRGNFGAIIVHGHSPVVEAEFKPNRIGIDTGAYMTGHLCCLRIDGNGPHILPRPELPS